MLLSTNPAMYTICKGALMLIFLQELENPKRQCSYWNIDERWNCVSPSIPRNLVVQSTPHNSNQIRFSLDFLYTFTMILPSVTRTLNNSNLPLTRSYFCFPSDHFYIILASLKLDPCFKRMTSTAVWNIKFIST